MANDGEGILVELKHLCLLTSSDFSALALVYRGESRIRWKYAFGNENERYKQIFLSMRRGLAGKVVTLGRPVILDATFSETGRIRDEYPIMLAENLHAALAAPVAFNGEIRGVLLVGHRSERVYRENDIQQVTEASKRIACLLKNDR